MHSISRRSFVGSLSALGLGLPTGLKAQNAPQTATTLFQDVRVFDGKSDRLSGPTNVLVEGKLISRIAPGLPCA